MQRSYRFFQTCVTLLFGMIFVEFTSAEDRGSRTYCNPLDIDYRYDWEHSREHISYRAGADPVIVIFNGAD